MSLVRGRQGGSVGQFGDVLVAGHDVAVEVSLPTWFVEHLDDRVSSSDHLLLHHRQNLQAVGCITRNLLVSGAKSSYLGHRRLLRLVGQVGVAPVQR